MCLNEDERGDLEHARIRTGIGISMETMCVALQAKELIMEYCM